MKSTIFKVNERMNEPAKSSCSLANTTRTKQNPQWHAHYDSKTDSKSSGQQFTTANDNGQPDRVKGSPGGTKPHNTTPRAGDHERED